jgi:hypothetical protein
MTKPENSSIRRSKVGEQRNQPADSTNGWRRVGSQVIPHSQHSVKLIMTSVSGI